MSTFGLENSKKLKETCVKIAGLMIEDAESSLNTSQTLFVADLIREFINNPIVKNSGILEDGK